MNNIVRDLQHKDKLVNKANFVIAAKIVDQDWKQSFDTEQLWAYDLGNNHFEICCIPIALQDICMGDVVETDSEYLVTCVAKVSSHFGFRVLLQENNQNVKDNLIQLLRSNGAVIEQYSSEWFIGVDAKNEADAKLLSGILMQAQQAKTIVEYETIRMK